MNMDMDMNMIINNKKNIIQKEMFEKFKFFCVNKLIIVYYLIKNIIRKIFFLLIIKKEISLNM